MEYADGKYIVSIHLGINSPDSVNKLRKFFSLNTNEELKEACNSPRRWKEVNLRMCEGLLNIWILTKRWWEINLPIKETNSLELIRKFSDFNSVEISLEDPLVPDDPLEDNKIITLTKGDRSGWMIFSPYCATEYLGSGESRLSIGGFVYLFKSIISSYRNKYER